MLKLEREKSLKNKIGVILSGTFLAMTLGIKPATAEEKTEDYFTVEYLVDDDNYDEYKLIIVSDFEMHNSVITTVDLFEKAVNASSKEVVINGIIFDRDTLIASKLESYDRIFDKNNIITNDGSGLKFEYIYDEDHSGKYKHDNGTYKLITISDYRRNVSVVTTVSIFEKMIEIQNGNSIVINDFEFDRKELLDARDKSLAEINEFSIIKNDVSSNNYIDVQYIYDDNHSASKFSFDEGSYKLVTIADYEYKNVVTMTIQMFEHAICHTHGGYVTINGITFDRKVLLNVKKQMDEIKENKERGKTVFNVFSFVVIVIASSLKSLFKKERSRRYY